MTYCDNSSFGGVEAAVQSHNSDASLAFFPEAIRVPALHPLALSRRPRCGRVGSATAATRVDAHGLDAAGKVLSDLLRNQQHAATVELRSRDPATPSTPQPWRAGKPPRLETGLLSH